MAGGVEREVKLWFESPEAARTAVAALGASPLRPRRLQSDALFDTDQRLLSARGQVLRVRVEDGRSFVTFKSPVAHPTLKIREEIETAVGDGALLVHILERSGFHIWFRYQKFREEFLVDDAIVAIDETPIGTFVEVEGSDASIATAVLGLGRAPGDHILDSYRTLYVRFCTERDLPISHMVFSVA